MTGQPDLGVTALDPRNLNRWDPLLQLFYRWEFTSKPYGPVVWGLALNLLFNLGRLAAAGLDGHLFTSNGVLGFFNDPSVYTNFLFGCVIFSFHVWLPSGVAGVFKGLLENRIFTFDLQQEKLKSTNKSLAEMQQEAKNSFNSRWKIFFAVSVFLAVFMLVGRQYRLMDGKAWYTAGEWSIAAAQAWAGLLLGSLTTLIYWFFHLIRHLRRMFREIPPAILPAHPDGVGGLSPLGQFALRLVYLISLVGVMLLAITPYTRGLAMHGVFKYTLSPGLVFAGAAYVIAAPLIFFFVLGTASNAMREGKAKALQAICDRVNLEYGKTSAAVANGDEAIEPLVKELEAARQFDEITRSFPVWPFDADSVKKFTTSYFAPVVVGLLAELINKLIAGAAMG